MEVRIFSLKARKNLRFAAAATATRAAIVRSLNCILIKRSENVEKSNEVNEVSWISLTSVFSITIELFSRSKESAMF